MTNYFSISEFIIDPLMRKGGRAVPLHVIDKIWEFHLPVLNDIRERLQDPLYISKRSGYRPLQWERNHGRDGTSQHVFRGKGAVDLTCRDNLLPELEAMLLESPYNRVAWYPEEHFFHCDYKGSEKVFFESMNGDWQLIENVR